MSRAIKVHSSRELAGDAIQVENNVLSASGTLVVAPSGLAVSNMGYCNRVASPEKGNDIFCEMRLAADQITNSRSQCLKVAVH